MVGKVGYKSEKLGRGPWKLLAIISSPAIRQRVAKEILTENCLGKHFVSIFSKTQSHTVLQQLHLSLRFEM